MKSPQKSISKLVLIVALLFYSSLLPFVFPIHPVSASEEENIDTFNVHPVNRWTVGDTSADIDTVEISQGCLRVVDVGDNTEDVYRIYRGLSKLDSKIEFKVKFITNTTTNNYRDRIAFSLYSSAVGTDSIDFYIGYLGASEGKSSVHVRVKGESGDQNLYFTEDFLNNTWYKVVIDYDISRSEYKIRTYSNAGVKLEEYDESDFTVRPKLFGLEEIKLGLYFGSYTSGKLDEFYVDYIQAPFKENDWTQVTATSGYDADNWYGIQESHGSADSQWRITVPYLDSFSGKMMINTSNNPSFPNAEYIGMYIRLYAVDGDDGDLHQLFSIELSYSAAYPSYADECNFYVVNSTGTATYWNYYGMHSPMCNDHASSVAFSVSCAESRNKIQTSARWWPDATVETKYEDTILTEYVDDVASDPSQEFVIEVYYNINPSVTTYTNFATLEDFGFVEKDIFEGLVRGIQNLVAGIFTFFIEIFVGIFRFLASVFKVVGAGIELALSSLSTILSTAIGAVQTAVEAVGTAIGNIASQVWAVFEDVLSGISDALSDLWTAISTIVADIVAEFIAFIGDLIDAAIAWLLTIISDLVDLLIGVVFFLWDAGWAFLGFDPAPDLIALIVTFGTGLVEAIANLPALAIDIITAIQNLWALLGVIGVVYVLIIPCLAARNIGEFIEKALHNAFTDITHGISIFGISVPIPFCAIWLVSLLAYVLTDTPFAGFF